MVNTMVNPRSFGRRLNSQSAPLSAQSPVEITIPKTTIECSNLQPAQHLASSNVSDEPSVDDELREWKRSRWGGFKIPWRQLSLMASLCFGIASFVLPDSVNNDVQWLLFALMAASIYAGIAKRREAKG